MLVLLGNRACLKTGSGKFHILVAHFRQLLQKSTDTFLVLADGVFDPQMFHAEIHPFRNHSQDSMLCAPENYPTAAFCRNPSKLYRHRIQALPHILNHTSPYRDQASMKMWGGR